MGRFGGGAVLVFKRNRRVLLEGVDVPEHLSGRGIAVGSILLHGAHHNGFQPCRNIRVPAPGQAGNLLDVLDGHCHRRLRLEGQPSGEHFVEHHAHRVEVRPIVGNVALGLLGAYVMHRADGLVGHGVHSAAGKPCNAEIGHLDGAVLEQHNVLGFDIPVNDPVVVGMLQGAQDLDGEVHGFLPIQYAFMLDIFFEGDAVNILHDDVVHPIGEVDIVYPHDVGVGKQSHRLGFILEPAEQLSVLDIFVPEDFDCDDASVGYIGGLVDIGHTADAHQLIHQIPPIQTLADILIHRSSPLHRRSGSRR